MQSDFISEVIAELGDARLVGGCVRDAYLKRKIKDIDIATAKKPEEVTEILESKGIKIVPTGITHGTVTAVKDKDVIEITTLRKDLNCDGRHAEIEFTDDWEEDAGRRDFTMNALSMDLDGNIHDYFDGLNDLKRGRVRFVGDPEARVQEDYLRILRYFRFEAHYGTHALDKASLDACAKYKGKIETLSGERIQAEMFKLLTATDPYHVLLLMKDNEILHHIMPGVTDNVHLDSIRHLVMIEKEEGSVMPSKDAIIRLALLIEEGHGQVEEICEVWKCSNADRKSLLRLVTPDIEVTPEIEEKKQKKMLVRLGKEDFIRQVIFNWAKDEDNFHVGAFKSMLALANTWQPPEFPVKGQDIIDLGIEQGEEVGKLLEEAFLIWEDSNYSLDKKGILERLNPTLPQAVGTSE